MRDTWIDRDRPVLEWLVEHYDQYVGDTVSADLLAENFGIDLNEAERALAALDSADPPYLVMALAERGLHERVAPVRQVTERARREVGAWPTPEGMADRLVAALNRAADHEPDEKKRGRLRDAAAYLGGAARDVLVDVTGAVVARSAGM